MKSTNNLSFNFIQTVNDKSENGMCVLEYPRKIWCEYSGSNKKILVSNGKSLVIKITIVVIIIFTHLLKRRCSIC